MRVCGRDMNRDKPYSHCLLRNSLLVLSLAHSVQSFAPPKKERPLFEGILRPYWAQEYIGADLAREAIVQFEEKRGQKFDNIAVGIVDGGFDASYIRGQFSNRLQKDPDFGRHFGKRLNEAQKHGTAVANVIVGNSPIAGAARAEIGALGLVSELSKSEALFQRSNVNIINASTYESAAPYDPRIDDHELFNSLKRISQGRIFVTIAGNEYPRSSMAFA